ncbi:hypothetical protein [Neobacillus bataviensis]|uniref:hypothetical protein n=1 Tax=Neobacillus bataviensis TaxID=220685 RepID=UPI001CC16F2D|nr:hypothetical protein [Neobacillus bataviensis]
MDIKTFFKKTDEIWYHYKSFILIGILFAGMILSLLPSIHHSKETDLQAVFIGNFVKEKKRLDVQRDITKKFSGERESPNIQINFWTTSDNTLSDRTIQQKLMAMIATGSVDIVVMDKKSFIRFAREGTFLPLDQFESKFSNGTRFLSSMDNGQEHCYGVKIVKNPPLEKAGYHTNEKVLGIVASSKNHKRALTAAATLVDY